MAAAPLLDPDRRSMMFEAVTRTVFPAMVVFALFLMLRGHNAPGGGFAAGLMVGLAITVRYLAGGRFELGEAAPIHPGIVLGAGLFLASGVGLVPLIARGSALATSILEWHIPLVGSVHLVTSVFFDLGVFLVVVGLVLDILRSLGTELDRQCEIEGARPHRRRAGVNG